MSEMTSKNEVKKLYDQLREEKPWRNPRGTVSHHRVLPYATLAPWLDDHDFQRTYEVIKQHTLVDLYRVWELWSVAKQIWKVEGDVLEVGVWRGGTGAILCEATRGAGRTVFLADTFTGVVKAGKNDTNYTGGEHSDTSVEHVLSVLNSLRIENAEILAGIFPEKNQHRVKSKIALLHVDVDVYDSAKDIVNWALPRLSKGGVIIFDDYGFLGCDGITKYCAELEARSDLIKLHNLNGHAIFIKI
jgi:O-methyltransferase